MMNVCRGTTIDLRDLDIICPERLTGAEKDEMYRQLHANTKHPEVPLDLFAKWVNSRHSELALRILKATKDLKWGEVSKR